MLANLLGKEMADDVPFPRANDGAGHGGGEPDKRSDRTDAAHVPGSRPGRPESQPSFQS